MADDAVDAGGPQFMPGLDCHQSAELLLKYEDRPETKDSASEEDHNAEPADAVEVESPEIDPVGVGGQIGSREANYAQDDEGPAIAAIFALA